MRVAVLGAGGTIAPAIVRDLAESDEISELLLLDIDLERAESVAREHGAGRASAQRADARAQAGAPDSLASAIEDVDVLVNSASYRVNLDAMRACLAARCHYLDLGGLYWMTARQLELAPDFERAELLGLLGIGSAPGKTNLMAAQAAAQLGQVDTMEALAAGRDLDPPPGFSVPYALQTLVDELTMPPIVLRDGEAVEIEPLTPAGEFDFGDPIGVGETIYTLHSEMRTFPTSFGCREGSFQLSLSPALLEKLRELVSAAPEEIAELAATAEPPSANTVSVHVVEARGGGQRALSRCVTPPHREWGLGGGVVSTAAPAAAAVRMLARGSMAARGVLPPELALDVDEMFSELELRGSEFELEVSEEVLR